MSYDKHSDTAYTPGFRKLPLSDTDGMATESSSPPSASASSVSRQSGPATPPRDSNIDGELVTADAIKASCSSPALSSAPTDVGGTPEGSLDPPHITSPEAADAPRTGSSARRSKRIADVPQHKFASLDASTDSTLKRKRPSLHRTAERSHPLTSMPSPGFDYAESTNNSSMLSEDAPSSGGDVANCVSVPTGSQRLGLPQIIVKESNLRVDSFPSYPNNEHQPQFSKVRGGEESEFEIATSFFAKAKGRECKSKFSLDKVPEIIDCFPPSAAPADGTDHDIGRGSRRFLGFDRENTTIDHSDGITKAASSTAPQPGSNQGSEAPSPSTKGGRSSQGGKSGKHTGRPGKQSKGKSGGAGGNRDRDSPDPSAKAVMTADESSLLKHIRLRQAELRRFYAQVLAQQKAALEVMASRDLSKLLKKQKAHTKVGEYEEVIDDLDQKEAETKSLIQQQYHMQVELAERLKSTQQDVIERTFQKHCEDAQREHVRGAQGDLIIFHKAHRAAADETGTDNGSDIEPYFPRYHELPEPDARPRGYTSRRVLDEKPFKDHLASYDEQAQREVIDKDIVGPVVQSVAEQNARQQENQERKSRFEDLVALAGDELRERGEHGIPAPLPPSENPQFALSRLADCAEFISRIQPEHAYVVVPVASRDATTFPRPHMERVPPPQLPPTPTTQQSPQPQTSPRVASISRRQKSLSAVSRTSTKEDETRSQSSSNNSTPLATLAPAPARMPPPPISTTHHFHHLPQLRMPPPPSNPFPPPPGGPFRPPILAPIKTSLSQTSPPATPTSAPPPLIPGTASQPPPPPPGHFRQNALSGSYPPPPPPHPAMPYAAPPLPRPAYSPTQQQPPSALFSRPPPPPPVERPSSTGASQPRFSHTSSSQGPPRTRIGGSRREKGQITFTPTQTPDSERFKSPVSSSSNHLPGQAVLRPGLAANSSGGMGTGKIGNTFVNAAPDANSRAQQAADAAKANANLNQVQGAGPKGGRRLLLPKGR